MQDPNVTTRRNRSIAAWSVTYLLLLTTAVAIPPSPPPYPSRQTATKQITPPTDWGPTATILRIEAKGLPHGVPSAYCI